MVCSHGQSMRTAGDGLGALVLSVVLVLLGLGCVGRPHFVHDKACVAVCSFPGYGSCREHAHMAKPNSTLHISETVPHFEPWFPPASLSLSLSLSLSHGQNSLQLGGTPRTITIERTARRLGGWVQHLSNMSCIHASRLQGIQ